MATHSDFAGTTTLGGGNSLASEGDVSTATNRDQHDPLLAALRAGRMVTFDWDLAADAVVRSANADEVFGPGATRDTGQAFFGRVQVRDREEMSKLIQALTPAQPDYEATYRYIRVSDGRELVLEDRGRAEFDGAGKMVRLRGLARDVTEQKRAEASEERLRTLLDHNPSLVFMKDEAGRYVYLNEAYEKRFVHSKDWLGKTDFDFWPKESAELFRKDDAEALHGNAVKQFMEDSRDLSGGRHCWLCYKFPFTDSEGRRYVGGVGIDATQQVEAEEKVRGSDAKYRMLFENMTEMFQILEPISDGQGQAKDFRYIQVNQATEKLTGRKRSEIEGKTATELWGVVEDYWIEILGRVSRTGESVRMENYSRELDSYYDLYAWKMNERMVAVLFSNITERKRAEEALRESEAVYRAIGESIQYGIWICDAQGRNTYASQSFLKLIGMTQEQCADFGWGNVLHPDDAEATITAWKRCSQSGETWYREHRFRGVDGIWHPILACGVPIRDESGTIVRWAGINLDISRLKRVEQELRESEERLALSQKAAHVGTWDWDMASGRLVWSEELFGLFGLAVCPEPSFDLWRSVVHPEDREAAEGRISGAVSRHTDLENEFRVVHRNGETRWIRALGRATYNDQGQPVRMTGLCLDVTERMAFQTELQRLVNDRTAKLQELVAELEHFSYTITHDLKSPLRAMRGFAEMMGMTCGECERTQAKDLLGRISTSAERMELLIRDALNYSRAVRQELPLEDVDAGALLRGMLDSYPEFQACKARIVVEGKLPVVLANQAGLTQCFSNLLGNAVKFVTTGQVPEIRVWANRTHGWVRIWVEDKGLGISKEMLPRVFDMFSRGSRDYDGTGIGLALVRKVAQRMGGKVGVESEEGKGSRFWIELKCAEVDPALAEPESRPTLAENASGEGTVLYVEDEESDAMFMERAFAGKGLSGRLRVAANGRAAINYLSGSGEYAQRQMHPLPSLVLLDLNLPQVPGFEVLKWMRNHPDFTRTPVVVFSSSTRDDDRVKAKELGANEFVAKPSSGLDFGHVVDALRLKWLGRAQAG